MDAALRRLRGEFRQSTYFKDCLEHLRRYAIDARKIERKLGWKPPETFETGIRKAISGTWSTMRWSRK